jgi:DNA polymerase-3 subunit beta
MEVKSTKIALLVDGDNAQSKMMDLVLEEASKYGKVTIRRVYGDWTTQHMNHWKSQLNEMAFNPIQKFSYTTGKNSTDSALIIDARFPDYKVVIPADNPYKLTVNKTDFQNALRRINVFSNKSTNQVALSISGSELQLSAQDVDFSFEGNERMSCQYDGEDLQIAFNARFLIEMLSAADTNEVVIELSTPTKAGIIKPTEQADNEELLMLVMPLMLNN